jgi:hypothetical protein
VAAGREWRGGCEAEQRRYHSLPSTHYHSLSTTHYPPPFTAGGSRGGQSRQRIQRLVGDLYPGDVVKIAHLGGGMFAEVLYVGPQMTSGVAGPAEMPGRVLIGCRLQVGCSTLVQHTPYTHTLIRINADSVQYTLQRTPYTHTHQCRRGAGTQGRRTGNTEGTGTPYSHYTHAPYSHYTHAPYSHYTHAPYSHYTHAPYSHRRYFRCERGLGVLVQPDQVQLVPSDECPVRPALVSMNEAAKVHSPYTTIHYHTPLYTTIHYHSPIYHTLPYTTIHYHTL